jgi:hypothetical protein
MRKLYAPAVWLLAAAALTLAGLAAPAVAAPQAPAVVCHPGIAVSPDDGGGAVATLTGHQCPQRMFRAWAHNAGHTAYGIWRWDLTGRQSVANLANTTTGGWCGRYGTTGVPTCHTTFSRTTRTLAAHRSCSFREHGAILNDGTSHVWASNSTCAPTWPVFYNHTECIYIHGLTKTYNGATKHGNGSLNSNASVVNCLNGGATGRPDHVWIYFDDSAGWNVHQLFLKTGAWHDPTFSKGSQHLTVSVYCAAAETQVVKVSGSSVSFAARIDGHAEGWRQGNTSYSNSTVVIGRSDAIGWGARVFWAAGTSTYTFC